MSQTTEALIIALVRRAARTAPSSLSARLEEEWLADMRERTSSLSRLRFAAGCYWASLAIGLEHRPLSAPVASAAQVDASFIVEPPGLFSSRTVTFGLVLSLHAALFCGLMMAGGKLFKPTDPPALEPRVIDQPRPEIKLPALTLKPFSADDIRVPPTPLDPPPVEPKVPNLPPFEGPIGPQPTDRTGVAPPHEIVRIQGRAGPAFPHASDYYPDVSRRMDEQGATTLEVCVNAAGQLTADPSPTESSGSGRLDAAAIKLAKAGSGHYLPSTEDGRPVAGCYPIKIRFQLQK
jgi:TonB family protein